ncbi:MAG: hypothetical protein ACJ8BF_12785 [Gemmatimonadales bacterium]
MIPVIPWYIVLVVLATNVALAVAVWHILSSAAGRSGLPRSSQRSIRIGAAIFLTVWLGAVLFLAPAPASLLARDQFFLNPLIPPFLILPPAVILLALWLSPAFRRVLAVASLPQLVGIQFYRTIGVVLLILLALGQVPPHFAVPAGWGDIGVGLTAPLVGLALARGVRGGRTLAAWWNAFGLLDLVVAVGMGTGFLAPLLAPDLGARVPPVAAMGVFPMIVVPTFTVPMSVLLHLVALARLRQSARLGSRVVREVVG